ncbi:MAG: hypothetical protein A2W91_12060 [Bacteroidetes bacterium GWF2_38_335]|nr:MAG: hypothetical protein A2W91_12060 [Bacteroidetes bacterium GWF2_38_335]OFY76907.1 MAG: hypothetical protein A2281_00175 [Bacteroidetes bacterium RIFOXYA12_FULL_38_20]HBS86756.1 ATPase [Bacteroidales bacterium]
MYNRNLEKVIKSRFDGKEIIILYGARQTGKTTLITKLLSEIDNSVVFNCERPDIKAVLESMNITQLKLLFGNFKYIALDEAQQVENIGKVLKLIYDSPEFDAKIIATGSSSFELAGRITEPLTGRNIKYELFPLSINEIIENKSWLWAKENLEELLLFGSYPGIINKPIIEKQLFLENLSGDYLYRDILVLENIKNPSYLNKLLKAIAYQIGSQVSYNELAKMIGVSMKTVEHYIDLLEKSFVIFSLPSFSRNARNELKKSKKIYFYDLGIRNALISDFSSIEMRPDKGGIWENFCIAERLKYNKIWGLSPQMYFWRTYDGAEIDLLEVKNGKLFTFEFKYKAKGKHKLPLSFNENYKSERDILIDKDNFQLLFE